VGSSWAPAVPALVFCGRVQGQNELGERNGLGRGGRTAGCSAPAVLSALPEPVGHWPG